jgi:transposase
MRGSDEQTAGIFSYLSPEARVRADHPLRAIRLMTDQVLRDLSPRFDRMYSDLGRPSIPPEQLLRTLLLQGLYTIRGERLLIEEIDYSILFRWFIGLSLDEPIWSPTTFSKNRDRLLQADVASAFFDAVVHQARDAGLMSDAHFPIDGTVLEAWASLKSFQRKDTGPTPPPDDPGIRRSISTGRPGRTTRITRPPTRTRSCIARGRAKKRSLPIWGTCCSTTATASSPTSARRRPRARANGKRRC